MNIQHIIKALKEILGNPNIDSPLEAELADQLRTDPDAYTAKAKEWTT